MPGRAAWTVGTRTLLARSCSVCFEFKAGAEFRVFRNGSRQAQCKRCQYLSSKRSERITNDHSIKHASRQRAEWTTYEIDLLRKLCDDGWAVKDIAYRLSRTAFAIQTAKTRWVDTGGTHGNQATDSGADS